MNIQNNKLIAEFMGLSTITFDESMYVLKWQNNLIQKKDDSIFKFDSDWNWLMPVVERILSLKNVYAQERQKVFKSITPDIKETYEACVEFIKWYNKNENNEHRE